MKLPATSFRRILLSRIILLTLPVLLVGQYVTYRKARSALLETARVNLTESAVNKSQFIKYWEKFLRSNLSSASQNSIWRSPNNVGEYQQFIQQLGELLKEEVNCVQLREIQTNKIVFSTCGDRTLLQIPNNLWKLQPLQGKPVPVYINYISPKTRASTNQQINGKVNAIKQQIDLGFSAPVYTLQDNQPKLQYSLTFSSTLPLPLQTKDKSFLGSTIIIDDRRLVIFHPDIKKVGLNVDQLANHERLNAIVNSALAGNEDSVHLFSLDTIENNENSDEQSKSDQSKLLQQWLNTSKKFFLAISGLKLAEDNEFLAGYKGMVSPITTDEKIQWVIISSTPLKNALAELIPIRRILFYWMLGLIATSTIVAIYLARALARPLEQLRDYAINVNDLDSPPEAPNNINIAEVNQLAIALDTMVERLSLWAEELEIATQEAQLANQLKNEFLANISHELRTPLNGIIGSLQLILDGFCDSQEEEKDFVEQANQSAIHLLKIINDILDIRKIELGTLSIMMQDTDIIDVLESAMDAKLFDIQEKGLKLILPEQITRVTLPGCTRETIMVYVDPEKLKQVFVHIFNNSIKFTEVGEIIVGINITPISKALQDNHNPSDDLSVTNSQQQVNITITDTGIGVDPDSMSKLFQPFVMADGSKTRKFGGNGLGLSISRHLIEMMYGNITLSSPGSNQGTTVIISLPCQVAKPAQHPTPINHSHYEVQNQN
jgi:signal transduction histidine kinase